MKTKTVIKLLRWNFTDAELNQMGQDLASSLDAIKQLEMQMKSSKKDYERKISLEEQSVSSFTSKLNAKHETREVECKVELHTPVEGKKTITRLDTFESWEEPMESRDWDLFAKVEDKDEEDLDSGQGEIDFDNAATAAADQSDDPAGINEDGTNAGPGNITDETKSKEDADFVNEIRNHEVLAEEVYDNDKTETVGDLPFGETKKRTKKAN